mgnify:FL=1
MAQVRPVWMAANHWRQGSASQLRAPARSRLPPESTHVVHARTGGDDPAVEEDGEELDDKVHVEESNDLLAPNSGVLGADVQDHHNDH